MAIAIARRAAQALLGTLESPEEMERVEKDLEAFRDLLTALPRMLKALTHPGISSERRRSLLDEAGTRLEMHDGARAAVLLLAEQRELRRLHEVITHFRRLKERQLGTSRAVVTTAQPVPEAERAAWEAALQRLTGARVRVEFQTDPSLIGGAVARVGSVLYDGSVRGSLERIRHSLLGE